MGNSIKNITLNIFCSALIVVSCLVICDTIVPHNADKFIYAGSMLLVGISSFFFLHKKRNNKFSIKLIITILLSFVLLFLFLFVDVGVNNHKFVDTLLNLKGEGHYVGETRSEAIICLLFGNVYPLILANCVLAFMIISLGFNSTKK